MIGICPALSPHTDAGVTRISLVNPTAGSPSGRDGFVRPYMRWRWGNCPHLRSQNATGSRVRLNPGLYGGRANLVIDQLTRPSRLSPSSGSNSARLYRRFKTSWPWSRCNNLAGATPAEFQQNEEAMGPQTTTGYQVRQLLNFWDGAPGGLSAATARRSIRSFNATGNWLVGLHARRRWASEPASAKSLAKAVFGVTTIAGNGIRRVAWGRRVPALTPALPANSFRKPSRRASYQ